MSEPSVKKNYIYNLSYQILIMLITIVTTPYLARVLGAEKVGIFSYTFSIVSYFTLFSLLGTSAYAQREIAYVQNHVEKRSRLFFEILIFRIITMILSLVVFYFVFIKNSEYGTYYKIFCLEIIAQAFDIGWFFQGIEDFKKVVVRNTIMRMAMIVLIFVFVNNPDDLWKYILLYVFSNVLGSISLWVSVKKYIIKIKIKDLNIVRHVKPTLQFFLPQIASSVYTILDKSMIGILTKNMTEVAYYEQSQKIVKVSLTIITSLGTVMIPRMSSIFAKGDNEKIKKYMKESFNFVWFLGFPIMFGLIAISRNLIPWFFGHEFLQVIPLMMVFSPIVLIIGISTVTGTHYLIPTKKQNLYTTTVIIGAITNVILNIIFILNFGAIGATISSLVSELVVALLQLKFISKFMNLKSCFNNCSKYFISSIIMFSIIFLIGEILESTYITTIIQIGSGIVVYFGLLWFMKDQFLLNNFHNILLKFGGKK